jgi:predicted negative regulator of RcsB-dependent stress response
MAHEFSKEELRRPDEFVSFFQSIILKLEKNKSTFLISLVMLLVAAGGYIGWKSYQSSVDKTAAIDFEVLMEKIPTATSTQETEWKTFLDQLNVFIEKHGKTSMGASAYLYKGKTLFTLKQYDEAIKSYQVASKKLSGPYVYLAQEGEALSQMQLGKWNEAEKILKFLSEKQNNPIRDFHLYNLALVQDEMGSKDLAMQTYEKIIKDFPDSTYVEKAKAHVGDVKVQ